MIFKELYVSRKEPIRIQTTQYTNAVPLVFRIMDWEIPSSAIAQIYVKKPSGTMVFNNAEINENDITVTATTQMTAEVGDNECQIKVEANSKVLHTFVFILEVSETIIDNSAIESQDEFTALEEALSAVSDVVTHSELQSKGAANKGVYFDANGVAQPMSYEVNSNVPAMPVIEDTVTVSSLPMTVTKAGITANHKAVYALLGTLSAQTADWTITPGNGSYTIDGSISGTTTLDLVFVFI